MESHLPSSPSPVSNSSHGDEFEGNSDTAMLSPSSSTYKPLPLKQKLGYSVGHVLNDLCSAIWFSYLLVFMSLVLGFSSTNAGILLLVGQIADGAATPMVGIFSNKITFRNYGAKKFWHLIGSISVLTSFPLIFNSCIFNCDNSSPLARIAYYSIFISIFQFGWASVQVSHLSLIPDLTPNSNERIGLNSLRYSWTVIASITVYIITWLVLSVDQTVENSTPQNETSPSLTEYLSANASFQHDSTIGPNDASKFRILVISIVSIGAFFTLLFHVIVDEKSRTNRSRTDEENSNERSIDIEPHLRWFDWFSVPQFYSIGILYMGTRLVINLTQVYIPFYLHFTLDLRKESIAYIPLIMYCASFLASLITKYLDTIFNKRVLYGIGGVVSGVTYAWMYYGSGSFYRVYGIFIVVILLGFSGALMLVVSLGLTNDLIGHNTSSGAFVFGAMSLLDKVSNGLAVMVIQKIHPTDSPSSIGHVGFYRDAITYACGGGTLIGLFGLIMIYIKPIRTYKRTQT